MRSAATSLVVLLACYGASAETAGRQPQPRAAVQMTPGTQSPDAGKVDAGEVSPPPRKESPAEGVVDDGEVLPPQPTDAGVDAGRDSTALKVEIPNVRREHLPQARQKLRAWGDGGTTLEVELSPPIPEGVDESPLVVLDQKEIPIVDDDQTPPLIHLDLGIEVRDVRGRQLDDGLRELESWRDKQPFTLEIALVPPKLPEGTDRELIRIFAQKPIGTVPLLTGDPIEQTQRPIDKLRVELTLGAEVSDVRGTALKEAEARLHERALTPVAEPRDSGDGWLVVRQIPTSGLVPLSSAVRLWAERAAASTEGPTTPVSGGPVRKHPTLTPMEPTPQPVEPNETATAPEPNTPPHQEAGPPPQEHRPSVPAQVTRPPARTTPRRVSVPNLIGRTMPEAREEAEAAGLVLVAPTTPGGDDKAKIATQQPAAKSSVAPGSQVKVTLVPPPPRFILPLLVVASAAVIAAIGVALRALRMRTRRKWVREHVQFRPAPAPGQPRATGARPSGSIPTLTLSPHGDPGTQTLHKAGPS